MVLKRGLLALLSLLIVFTISIASSPTTQAARCKSENANSLIFIKPWYSGLCKAGTDKIVFDDAEDAVGTLLLNLLSIAIQIAGYAAVGLVIWGGIKYILSQGDSGKTAAAKKTIQNALIGLAIALAAVAIVNFVTELF